MDSSQLHPVRPSGVPPRVRASLCPGYGRYARTERSPGKAAVFLARCPNGVATTSAARTRTPRRCWHGPHGNRHRPIAGVFPSAVADRPVVKTPFGQAMVNVILIGIHPAPRGDEPLDERPEGGLPDVLQPPDHYCAPLRDYPEDRGFFVLQGARPRALQPAPTPQRPFFDGLGMPFMAGHPVRLIAFHLARPVGSGWRATIPSRSGSVIRCASSRLKSNSWAIWALDRFNQPF